MVHQGGGGYWVNPGAGNRNWWFSGILLQHQVSRALYLGGEIYHSTPQTVGGSADTAFSFGGGYSLGAPYQVLFSLGRNLNHVNDNRLSWYLALYRTFERPLTSNPFRQFIGVASFQWRR